MALILAFLPTFLLSGFIFPIQNMPRPIQVVTYVVPARYFLVALRGIVLKGVGLATIWGHLAALRGTRSWCSAWRRCASRANAARRRTTCDACSS